MYRDEYDLPPRYSREYYERDRYEERDRPLRSGYPPAILDDPYYRMRDEILPPLHSKDMLTRFGPNIDPEAYPRGSVLLIMPPPFSKKPPLCDKPSRCNTVFVGSLPENTTETHLYDAFCDCGPIMDVRVARSRRFGHVEFKHESSVDKAIQLNNAILRVGPDANESSKIQVDFAQSKEASDAKRRMKTGESLAFNAPNAQIISTDLRGDDTFEFACKNLVMWMEKGSCSTTTANTFFGLISNINNHCHKLVKEIKVREEECQDLIQAKKLQLEKLLQQCDIVDSVFEVATQQKAWDNFTKPQRKTLTQWKDYAQEVRTDINTAIEKPVENKNGNGDEPPAKRSKTEETETEASLARANREIEQLKLDQEIALEKKEKQILQLKTLLARFKQNCPEEWEKVIGGGGGGNGEANTGNGDSKQVSTDESPTKVKQEEGEGGGSESGGEWEVIDGVNMDDLNRALEGGTLGDSLAAAAAAYAQLRTQMGSAGEEIGLGLSENDIALTAVMAAFLTVHPLGASLAEMQSYFLTLNSNYNSYYLESLLRRLPKVFQLSQTSSGEPRWWFLGFQTVSMNQYGNVSEMSQNETEMVDADSGVPVSSS